MHARTHARTFAEAPLNRKTKTKQTRGSRLNVPFHSSLLRQFGIPFIGNSRPGTTGNQAIRQFAAGERRIIMQHEAACAEAMQHGPMEQTSSAFDSAVGV